MKKDYEPLVYSAPMMLERTHKGIANSIPTKPVIKRGGFVRAKPPHWSSWVFAFIFLIAMAFMVLALTGSLSSPAVETPPTTYFRSYAPTGLVTTPSFHSVPEPTLL